jgi:hypothetical protein
MSAVNGGLWDTVTLGRRRRARRIERLLRALDEPQRRGRRTTRRRRRGGEPLRVLAVTAIVAVVASVWIGVFAPRALPLGVRVALGMSSGQPAPHPTYAGASYRFEDHQRGQPTVPVGYDPCTTIQVRLNPDGAPSDALDLVRTAMTHVHDASGLRFRYDGATSDRPNGLFRRGPFLVAWATPGEVPGLAGRVVGLGGSNYLTEQLGRSYYASGTVTLDATTFSRMSPAVQQAVVDHEFGHLVGLAHVPDPSQLMYADNVGQTRFGHGDLTGLALLGQLPCR